MKNTDKSLREYARGARIQIVAMTFALTSVAIDWAIKADLTWLRIAMVLVAVIFIINGWTWHRAYNHISSDDE